MEKMYKKNIQGFTLFEIMVVVVILGLLMIISIPSYIKTRDRATRDICISNQKMILTAATIYAINETDSLEDLSDTERLDALVDKGYLKGNKWRECPASADNDYNDYTIVFKDGQVDDVKCAEYPAEHG